MVSTDKVKWLGLTTTPNPQPYRVSWIDTSSIIVTHRCHMPIEFGQYKNKIWCDIVPMDVGYMILGRPWLFDLNTTLYSRTNT